jgi:hypothetical protein
MFVFWCLVFQCTNTAKTGKMILANLGCYKLEATPGVKITSPVEAKRCIDSNNFNPFNRLLLSSTGLNDDYNFDASTHKGNPLQRISSQNHTIVSS